VIGMTDNAISELYKKMFDKLHIFESGKEQKNQILQKNDDEIANIVGTETFLEIDGFISAETGASEHYGFVTGFKYAMQLMLAGIGKEI